MIIKKYRQFLLQENKQENWKDRFESRLVYFKDLRNKKGEELKDGVEEFILSSDQETINHLTQLDNNELQPVMQEIVKNMSKMENRYWNTTLSIFYSLVIYMLLFWNVKVEKGVKDKADIKLKEITGERIDIDSKTDPKDTKKDSITNLKDNAKRMNKEYKDNINKLKAELNRERKVRQTMEKKMKKYLEEKEKLEKEKKALEKKNKELKERERLKEIAKRLNQLEIKLGSKHKD
jgi:hypothetical protein